MRVRNILHKEKIEGTIIIFYNDIKKYSKIIIKYNTYNDFSNLAFPSDLRISNICLFIQTNKYNI